MIKRRPFVYGPVAAVVSCVLATACSSGGGRTIAVPKATVVTPVTTPSTYCGACVGPPSIGEAYSTGIPAGSIAAPLPGSLGSAQQQIATSGSPNFATYGSIPVNVTFPGITTALTAGTSGMTAAPNPDASITILAPTSTATPFKVVIPSLNINGTIQQSDFVADPNGYIVNNSYNAWGFWGAKDDSGSLLSASVFTFGYATPTSAMPTSGNAQFSGFAAGTVFNNNNGNVIETSVSGNAALTANFSSGLITGALSQMRQSDGMRPVPGNLPWNDVSLNASIAPGTSAFSGTAAAASAPGTTFSLAGTATGHLDGAFYGPAAQNIGAVWSLSDGNKSVIGTLNVQTGK